MKPMKRYPTTYGWKELHGRKWKRFRHDGTAIPDGERASKFDSGGKDDAPLASRSVSNRELRKIGAWVP